MNAWSNIKTSTNDFEIQKINKFEKSLNSLSASVQEIRNLITGFEVCHFKYQKHLNYIKEAILTLNPNIKLREIGKYHIRHGEKIYKNDKTGRSLLGQKYVNILNTWLEKKVELEKLAFDKDLSNNIFKWLGEKNLQKEKLIRLLISRLTWNWETYEKLLPGEENEKLKNQICRVDICHYNFPNNLNLVIQGIGKLKAALHFKGCGSFNYETKRYFTSEFLKLKDLLQNLKSENNDKIKRWLLLCLLKTLKEQTKLQQTIF